MASTILRLIIAHHYLFRTAILMAHHTTEFADRKSPTCRSDPIPHPTRGGSALRVGVPIVAVDQPDPLIASDEGAQAGQVAFGHFRLEDTTVEQIDRHAVFGHGAVVGTVVEIEWNLHPGSVEQDQIVRLDLFRHEPGRVIPLLFFEMGIIIPQLEAVDRQHHQGDGEDVGPVA